MKGVFKHSQLKYVYMLCLSFSGTFQINLVIFILALRSALSSSEVNTTRTLNATKDDSAKTKATGSTLRKAKVGLKGSAILLPLLGLTWIFGLVVFNRDTIVFKYLFAICNSLQGMMIFLFHVLINRKVCLKSVNFFQIVQTQNTAANTAYTRRPGKYKVADSQLLHLQLRFMKQSVEKRKLVKPNTLTTLSLTTHVSKN